MARTKSIEQSIQDYGSKIKSAKNFAEGVHMTVGQYLGGFGNVAFINMIREVLQNSTDELMKAESPCDEVWVAFNETKQEVMIKDNGRGIPFDKIIDIFTREHTSSNYNKGQGEFSSGRHGVGAKATTACSEKFVVDSYILGKHRRVTFKLGDPETAKIEDLKNKDNYQGTIITFTPSYWALDELRLMNKRVGDHPKTTVKCQDIINLISSIVPMLTIGSKINFIEVKDDGSVNKTSFINKNGLLDLIRVRKPVINPITINGMADDGSIKAEIVFTYDSEDDTEDIKSFANFNPTRDHGTHIIGFKDGLVRYFKNYMNKFFLSANSKLVITNSDIQNGLNAVVHVCHIMPTFNGQSKFAIANQDITPFVKDLVEISLDNWSKAYPNDLQKLCKYFKDVAEIRTKGEKERVKIKVENASAITGLPTKFVRPTGKKNLELFIVEGDSAKGPAKNNRINEMQGLLPIRGKILSALKEKDRAKFFRNEEVSNIITVIGAGYGKNFDIGKCKWDKVIICTDADPDGAHIRCLLLSLFLIYLTPLIEAGKLYATVPPLYGGQVGKGKKGFKYFIDRADYNSYLQSLFSKTHELHLSTGEKVTPHEAVNLLNNNVNYIRDLESVANSFAIDPKLLEYILVLQNSGIRIGDAKFKKAIENKYRFLKVGKNNIEGLVDGKYQTIYFNDILWNSFTYISNYLNKSPYEFKVDGEICTLYDVMKLYNSIAPSSIQRYKGLGEMNGKQLFESTLDPSENGNRVLMQYTLEDAKEEIQYFRKINSDKLALMKDIDVSSYVF